MQATNWRAEQAIRPAVVCRKQWGGNATWAGFHAAVGEYDGDRLLVEHGIGGDPHLLTHLAELIADHPTGRHRRTR